MIIADGVGQSIRATIVASRNSPATGNISSTRRFFTAPAHPSWGGAALIDADGDLLGIGSLRLLMMHNNDVADINMVVPIDLLPPILDDC